MEAVKGCRSNENNAVSLASRFGHFGGVAAVRVGSRLGSWGAPARRRGDTALCKHRLRMSCFVGMSIFTCLMVEEGRVPDLPLIQAGDYFSLPALTLITAGSHPLHNLCT